MSKTLKNTAIYTIGNMLPQAASFILLPIYTQYLSPKDYGIVNSMQVVQSILTILFSLCLERSIYRLYWDYKTEQKRRDFLGTINISIITISIVSIILVLLFKNFVQQIFTDISFYPFYILTIFTTFISVFSLVPMIHLMVKQEAIKYITLSVVRFLLSSFFVLFFIIVKQESAVGMLKGGLISIIIMSPIYFYIMYRSFGFNFKLRIFKSAMTFSLPMIPAMLASWVLTLSDRIFIERYFSLTDVGLYSLSSRIAGIIMILSSGYSMAYSPIFFSLASSSDQAYAKKTISKYNNISIFAIIGLAFTISLFAKEFVTVFLNQRYLSSYYIVPIMALSCVLLYISGVVGQYFQQSKKTKQDMFLTIGCAMSSIGINYLLVPIYGPYGAALSSVLVFSFGLIISYNYAKMWCYFVPLKWKEIILLIVILTSVILFFYIGPELEILQGIVAKILVIMSILLIYYRTYKNDIKSLINMMRWD